MTDEQINRAIAECEGLTGDDIGYWYCHYCKEKVQNDRVTYAERHHECGNHVTFIGNDYATSLDAMAGVVAKLDEEEWLEFTMYLPHAGTLRPVIEATARQRAIAFCKMKGIYRE